jgi:hypothetical protein
LWHAGDRRAAQAIVVNFTTDLRTGSHRARRSLSKAVKSFFATTASPMCDVRADSVVQDVPYPTRVRRFVNSAWTESAWRMGLPCVQMAVCAND